MKALPDLKPGQSWCCAKGCGACSTKEARDEYSREEFQNGDVISKTQLVIVSKCCCAALMLWDEGAQDFITWRYAERAAALPATQPVDEVSEPACKMCGDTPRIAAQRLMLKERFANREPSPATADFDLPPACIEEPPTAPDAGARDANRTAAKLPNGALVQNVYEAYEAGLEEAAQLLLNGHFLHDQAPPKLFAVEAAKAIRALKTAPAKPAQDLVTAPQIIVVPNGPDTPLNTLLMQIEAAFADYERFGATCTFESQPMIHASTLEEIAEQAALVAAHLKGTP